MTKKTILIVDDTPENLYLLRVILEEEGYKVIEAIDGSEGLKKLNEYKNIDLIISDILMPVMDGFLFCQACKEDAQFKQIPFVFYTSTYTEKLDEDFALKLGAVQFLRKPIDHDEVLLTVENIFKDKKPSPKVKDSVLKNEDVFKLYNERLINKLEQKSLALEIENTERKKAKKLLIQKNNILNLIANSSPLNKVFEHILFNFETNHPGYFGAISLLQEDGTHLNLVSAPSIPEAYNLAFKRIKIGKNVGSCGTAAFTKKPVIVSDISTDALWKDYKDIALKHHLKSCWSIPILSKSKDVLGTFAIYSKAVKSPTKDEITQLNDTVSLAYIAIEKYNILAEIKKRDESYKSLINQANDAILTYTLDGTIYNFNKASYINLGYSKKEFKTLKIQDVIVGEVVANQDVHSKLLKGTPVIFYRNLKRKDGTLIDVEVSAKLQKDTKILAIVRDITERKLAEKKLQESEKSLLEAQRIAKIGSYNYNVNTQVVQGSTTYMEIIGVDLNTKVTYDLWRSIVHPDDTPNNQVVFERCLKTGEQFDIEFRIITKNKQELKWIHGIGEFIYNHGKPVNFVGTIQDITERKQAEIALKAAKEFTDKLIMSMQEGLLIVNLEGEIMMVNKSFCDILGYTEKELIGLNLPYPFAKTEDLELMLAIKDDVATGETKSFQLEFFKKNGDKFLASFLSGNILDDKGEVIAFFGTVKDITEEDKVKKTLEEVALKSTERKNTITKLASLVGENLNTSFKKVVSLSAKALKADQVTLFEYIDNETKLISKQFYNTENNSFESGLIFSVKDYPNYFNTITSTQILNIANAQENLATKEFAEVYLIPNNISSRLDLIIKGDKSNYGVLSFERKGEHEVFTPEDESFALSINNIVSLMVETTQRRAAEAELEVINKELKNSLQEIHELKRQLEQENVYLRDELDLVFNYEEMVYGSEAFSNVLTEIEKVAPTVATVLLLGESGTGKELLARAIHNISLRANKPLIKINCAAIPRELIESELFGHKKGSFTGAINDKIGKFELANGGTVFLDEIGELPLDMQPKILRFLQEGEIEVVGGTNFKKLDVRVIATTNRNLLEQIKNNNFREDLYFRLNVFPIIVPPLRQRIEDIPLLVEHFVNKFNKAYNKTIKYVSEDAMAKLKAYSWPGNIRELENLIERASILSNSETLVIPGFESKIQKATTISNKDVSLNKVQRDHILQVLEQCNWKISGPNGAAVLLDLKPSTLRDKMAKLGIKKPNSN
jgi:PAS domain S-box-containing protein